MEKVESIIEQVEKTVEETSVVLQLGGKPEEADITLRFFGDDLEPEEITKALNCQPTDAHKKGDVITSKYTSRTVKTGTWLFSGEKNSDQNLEKQILDLFDQLPKDLSIWQDLTKRFDADIYCGAWLKGWNRDIWFNAELLKQISDRGLQIGIAIYCDCDDEDDE